MPKINELSLAFPGATLEHLIAAMLPDVPDGDPGETVAISLDQLRVLMAAALLGGDEDFITTYNAGLAALAGDISDLSDAHDADVLTLSSDIAARLLKSANLSDLANVATARANLGADGNLIQLQTFTSSDTYTPHADMRFCIVEAVGGGGGGGCTQGAAGTIRTGSGGSGAEYARKRFLKADIGASKAVVIGAGGAGAVGATPTDGGNGGDTTLGGTLLIAKGGIQGKYTITGTSTADIAAGGSGGTGDLLIPGAPGGCGYYASNTSVVPPNPGVGGASVWGRPGKQRSLDDVANAFASTGFGSGGNASGVRNTSGTPNGAAGQPGLLIVWEYR